MMKEMCELLIKKGELKENIFDETHKTFSLFKKSAESFESYYKSNFYNEHKKVEVEYRNISPHEFQLRFAGDVLIFMMHSNIFEFPRNHEVMSSKYIAADNDRSYCGQIQIFNFLADSFKYNRINDLGYMIGRILINKEGHYYVEGKRELAQVLNNFSLNKISDDTAKEIVNSAIKYAINFDLLLPNYAAFKEISVNDMINIQNSTFTLATAKRLGFRFERDEEK